MEIKNELNRSFKWSVVTELLAKLITPILNAVLARILLPDAFAPLANITMIISFAEVFVEQGFRKYLIQHDFKSEDEYDKAFHVAFWANLGISIFLWLIIAVFSKPIAAFLGSPEIWNAILLSGILLPLYSVSGILNAKLQRNFQFKKLFIVRIITAFIPLFITIPLAFLGFNSWSLVIGNIASIFAQAAVLAILCRYKPNFYFSFKLLKEMFMFGSWTILDGIAVWLTAWVDSLLIAHYMTPHYLGIYKNSLSTINNLFAIVTSAIMPVLFVGLSKLQNDDKKFSDLFCDTQRTVAMVLMPLGIGVFIYSDFAVEILFGKAWSEAAGVVGAIGLSTAIRTVFVSICSDAYRAKAKVKLPLILQLSDLVLIVTVCVVSAKYGFWPLVYSRSLVKLDLIIPEIIIMKKVLGIEIENQARKLMPVFIAILVMTAFCYLLRSVGSTFIWNISSIVLAAVVYFGTLLLFPSGRKDIKAFLSHKKG